ncbi:D-3-phosphoglycerate dehydrogenase [Haloactinopolyspora alba]|uniref:D-3-phosphoglycerate dehydrogenase n=1 Tax=Haloactinopolyspora alba TaxID=648780 RepID=A0A2P8EG23_9ACTN|nr:NAD(P)-dependent oxidoreductase [Haloactinopolyspora alba]PSL08400.1 D-3-phosphoglycerate dehydrogenase [Haloactinopolyspora alba]
MTAEVVVAEGIWGEPFERMADVHQVRRIDGTPGPAELVTAEALVVRNRTPVTRELLEAAPRLRVVARAGAGLDNIDVASADAVGVVVVGAAGANAVSVAEHSVGLALALARRTVELDAAARDGGWTRHPGRELAGGVWGTLSAGATARATARLARGLGMSVVAYDPYRDPDDPELTELGITLRPLAEVVASADVLSIHLPATPETERMVDSRLLSLAKPGLLLINAGRGEIVDESALVEALREGRVAGAGLDVRQQEPPSPGLLETLPNVVLTPHIAGITVQSQDRIARILRAGVESVLADTGTPFAVTAADRSSRGVSA